MRTVSQALYIPAMSMGVVTLHALDDRRRLPRLAHYLRLGGFALLMTFVAMSALYVASAFGLEHGSQFASEMNGPDGRIYELVSPAEKSGNEAGGIAGRAQLSDAAPNGERILYGTSGLVGAGPTGLGPSYSLSERTSSGWRTRGVMPRPSGAPTFGDVPGVHFAPAPNLTYFAFATQAGYVAPSEEGTPNLYLAGEDAKQAAQWISRPTIANPLTETSVSLPQPAGQPSDSGTLYFTDHGSLLPEDVPRRTFTAEFEPAESTQDHAWGFYEWSDGKLAEAGTRPDGTLDVHGAVPAATGELGKEDGPDFYAHQVSADGSRAFFISPDPLSLHPTNDPVELYLREHGQTKLVSRNEFGGGEPSPTYQEHTPNATIATGITATEQPGLCSGGCSVEDYVYATEDGSRAYFMSRNALSTGEHGEIPTGSGPWTYRYDTETGKVTYVPGVDGPILGSSADGSRLIYMHYTEGERRDTVNSGTLYLWEHGASRVIAELPRPLPLPEGQSNELLVAPVRVTADGSVVAFVTNAAIPSAKGADGATPANNHTGWSEVYRYDAVTDELLCVSCAPSGSAEIGEAHMSNNDQQESEYNVPSAGWGTPSRGMSADGSKIFFDTPQSLVTQDTNNVRDVYEWEGGKQYLVSAGNGPEPSFFLDSSESGRDIFFATSDNLVSGDTDGGYDVYDAREGGGFVEAATGTECTAGCQKASPSAPSLEEPSSVAFAGAGNLAPPPTLAATGGLAPVKTAAEIRAARLKATLAQCRKQRSRHLRRLCETRAKKSSASQRTIGRRKPR